MILNLLNSSNNKNFTVEEEELIQFFIEQKILFLIPKFLSNKKN